MTSRLSWPLVSLLCAVFGILIGVALGRTDREQHRYDWREDDDGVLPADPRTVGLAG